MDEPTEIGFDLTIFRDDGVTPWFGSADVYGEVVEADFQTPSPDHPHDRPYMLVPGASAGAEIDFLNGASSLASWSASVVDMRQVANDQATGIVTSMIRDAAGRRAVMRRLIDGEWVKVFEGVVHGYSETEHDLLTYHFHLRDTREFERGQPLFFSNHVVLGKDFRSGPSINYGRLADFSGLLSSLAWMLRAVEPFESVSAGGINHFKLLSDPAPADGIHYGKAALGNFTGWPGVNLADIGNPSMDGDGIYRYREITVRWRAQGSSDPWTDLRAMPRAEFKPAVEFANLGASGPIGGGDPTFFGTIQLYFGSTDPDDLPGDEQEVEFYVLAARITDATPFWWDGGTLGDLLQEIVAGDHTEEPPRERYDAAALAAFALSSPPARFILRQPVTDRLRWVEENIYAPAMVAPRGLEIEPVSMALPDNQATVPRIPSGMVTDLEVRHGVENAVGAIEFTYLREHLLPVELVAELKEETSLVVKVQNDVRRQLNDEAATEPWRRLVETPVLVSRVATDAVPGAKTLRYAPVTIRSIGTVDGRPSGGDIQQEHGQQIADRLCDTVLPLYQKGARVFEARVPATTDILALRAGDLVSVDLEIVAVYETGRRGA